MPTNSFPNTYLKFSDYDATSPTSSENGIEGDWSEWIPMNNNLMTFFVHWNDAATTVGKLVVRWYPTKAFYTAVADFEKGAPLLVIDYANVNDDPVSVTPPRWGSAVLPPLGAPYGGGCRIQIQDTDCTAVRVQIKTQIQ